MDAAHCEGGRGRARNRGEVPVVEINGDGVVAARDEDDAVDGGDLEPPSSNGYAYAT